MQWLSWPALVVHGLPRAGNRPWTRFIGVILFVCFGFFGGSKSGAQEVDWSSWEEMPVFHNGRVMPLISFAEETVELICGRASPVLGPAERGKTDHLFPGGPRRFRASELLLSWIVEPERWHDVPFLFAGHEELRALLGVPLRDEQGQRLRHVSPRQVSQSPRFRELLRQVARKAQQANAEGRRPRLTPLEESGQRLYQSFSVFQALTYRPTDAAPLRDEFWDLLVRASDSYRELRSAWEQLGRTVNRVAPDFPAGRVGTLISELQTPFHDLIRLDESGNENQSGEGKLAKAEQSVVQLRRAAEELESLGRSLREKVFAASGGEGLSGQSGERIRAQANQLASAARRLSRTLRTAHLAMFEGSYSLRVVPSLDPNALEADRDEQEESHVWVGLSSLIWGSEEILAGMPPSAVEDVRRSYQKVADLWTRGLARGSNEDFSQALRELAAAIGRLGQELEPLRRQLVIHQADPEFLAATAYPTQGDLYPEILYHRLEPFRWAWIASLIALVGFGLSFGFLRWWGFGVGVLMMALSAGFITAGLVLRSLITGFTPVTNMFETVVFVALVTAIFGLWLVNWPLFGPGLSRAWRLTAIPGTFEASPLTAELLQFGSEQWWQRWGWVMGTVRAILAMGVAWVLTSIRSGAKGGEPVFSILPRGLETAWTWNDLVVWLVGLAVVLCAMWVVPRVILAFFALGVFLGRGPGAVAAASWREQLLSRRTLAAVTAAVVLLTSLVAYLAPISGKRVGPLMPVLRDNFWLTLHVLTITASYGAGALVWGLANLSLLHFLLGRYREIEDKSPAEGSCDALAPRKLPPEACTTLAQFMYRGMQVAVLLLAAGTIFGGLWADVSWGRFWGWDSKEVWALIALLVYLGILHARLTGLVGEFGLAAGAILGATAIIIAWYGVNFVFGSGLHSYGEGTGGGGYVALALVLNWLLVGAAWLRYRAEMQSPRLAAVGMTASQGSG
jgi:ABC-type transport system involved in cytochrome c biogenesis permease subunit